jgi:NADH-quinone oxidoreductase subunit M
MILTLLTFLPLIGAALIALIPDSRVREIKAVAIVAAVATLIAAIAMAVRFHPSNYHFQLLENVPWIPSLGITYLMGVDGISLGMVLLTAVLGVVAVAYSLYETRKVKLFMLLLLVLETSMLGTFLALDLILFYAFFELALFPLAILTLVWGGENRTKAAMRVFLYLFGGSILMLVGMVWMAHQNQVSNGIFTFNLLEIQNTVSEGRFWTGAIQAEPYVFWAFAIAFLIKSPAFPFHTWLIDSYTEAPIGAVLLGVLVKTGTYGLIRFNLTLFPQALPQAAPTILALAVIGILYGGIVAAVQNDLRRLIAYSSVAHIGFILLGIFSLSHDGLVGGVLGQLNHGIATGALILLVGFLILRKRSTDVRQYGGLMAQMPVLATLFLLATVAAVGLPGTNAFVGEFLALLGMFESGLAQVGGLSLVFVVLAAAGVILSAVYMLIGYKRIFHGPIVHGDLLRLKDLKPAEVALAGILIAAIFVFGVQPALLTKSMEPAAVATQEMGLNLPGMRPSWSDDDMRLDEKLNLTANRYGRRIVLARAEDALHPDFGLKPPKPRPTAPRTTRAASVGASE